MRRVVLTTLGVLLAAITALACVREPRPALRIAAASDLKFALDAVVVEFAKAHPEIKIEPTYGSSGNFATQLANKAPFDLFLSADIAYPKKLIDEGLAIKESAFSYALGHVVVWVPKGSPLGVERAGLKVLLDPSVKKIAIANPKHAPYGRAAEAAMKSAGVFDSAKERLVLGENVSQAAQFVETGAAQVGVIALSLALAPPMKEKGTYYLVPSEMHPPMEQGGVIMNWAQDREAAETFRAFMMSDEGKRVLKGFGFEMPAEVKKETKEEHESEKKEE